MQFVGFGADCIPTMIFNLYTLIWKWVSPRRHVYQIGTANLRVCCDGTYRVTREDYAIITLGLISKTRARGKQPSWLDRGFCTQFHEMVIGLVRKEAENSYTDLMNGFVTATKSLVSIDPTGALGLLSLNGDEWCIVDSM